MVTVATKVNEISTNNRTSNYQPLDWVVIHGFRSDYEWLGYSRVGDHFVRRSVGVGSVKMG